MFTYRLHLEDGSDAGEATYAVMVKPGEEIIAGHNQQFRVSMSSRGTTPQSSY